MLLGYRRSHPIDREPAGRSREARVIRPQGVASVQLGRRQVQSVGRSQGVPSPQFGGPQKLGQPERQQFAPGNRVGVLVAQGQVVTLEWPTMHSSTTSGEIATLLRELLRWRLTVSPRRP